LGFDPKKVNTPEHWADVVHSGTLGADDMDGVFEGAMEGLDEGFVVAVNVGWDDGANDTDGDDDNLVEGSAEGKDAHPLPNMVDSSDPKLPPPSRTTSLSYISP